MGIDVSEEQDAVWL